MFLLKVVPNNNLFKFAIKDILGILLSNIFSYFIFIFKSSKVLKKDGNIEYKVGIKLNGLIL